MSTEYAHIRAAFRYVTLGLMEWADPPELSARQYRRLELVPESDQTYTPLGRETLYGTAEYVDPYDLDADWEERA